MKTKGKILVTLWQHPETGQILVVPGAKHHTGKIARQWIGVGRLRGIWGREEYWSAKQIANLPEDDS